MRRATGLVAGATGGLIGVESAVIATRDPGYAYAGSASRVALELVTGYLLLACGLACCRRRGWERFGVLLVAAACGWFLLEWNNPGAGSPLVFTVGLLLYAVAPALVAHALLTRFGPRMARLDRVLLAAAYGGAVIGLGLLPALVFDPAAQGCSQCPDNLVLVRGAAGAEAQITRIAVWIGLGWTCAAVILIAVRWVRSSAARRRSTAPVLAAGVLYLALVAAEFAISVGRGYLSNGPADQRLWLAEATALMLLVAAVGWTWLRARRTRADVARLVVELAAAPSPGRLQDALAGALDDPGLRLVFPATDGCYIDADGRPAAPAPDATALVRDGVEVAVLTHRPGLFDEPGLVDEVAATARLALEHERLRAELLFQLEDLRASRARIVATGDAERRRLERDLHDGAQQRLVALGLDLQLARIRLDADGAADGVLIDRVERAEGQVATVLAELRTLASGIFPAVLADDGLAAALEALAEETRGQLRISALTDRRFDLATEAAAYRVISQTLAEAGGGPVSVSAVADDRCLVLELVSPRSPAGVTELEDRVGAIDGTLSVSSTDGADARIRAEIPCAS